MDDLGAEFPALPIAGMPVFTSGGDWPNTANTTKAWILDSWDHYADGYRSAADQLVDDIVERRLRRLDAVVYPLVYLYRHYLELRLKQLIPLTGRYLYLDQEFPARHDLLLMWDTLRPRLEHGWEGLPSAVIEAQLREFERWDRDSYAFRYPEDKRGKPNLVGLDQIDVRHLKEVVARLSTVFDTVAFGIGAMLDLRDDVEAELQNYYATWDRC